MPTTTRRTVLAASAMGLVAAGVRPARAAAKSTITAALTGEPESLDPIYDTNLWALNVSLNVFNQLAGIDAGGKTVPRLATEWSHDDSLTTWTFKLRPGVTFHDGSPATSADVVFTYESAMHDAKSRLGGYLRTIKSVTATSPSEVVFQLNTPFAPFDRQTALIPIVCKAAYQKLGAAGFATAPVGCGPYTMAGWKRGDTITLKRFDGYWGTKGAYETVVFRFIGDDTTRANSIQSGDLDIALLGPSSVAAVKASGTVDVVTQASNRVLYVGFSGQDTSLKDERVRKAIDLAIDRQALSTDLMNGAVTPTGQLVAPISFGFDPAIPATQTDLPRARSLLKEAGYGGAPITLSYPTAGLPQIDLVAQAVAGFLQEAGLAVTLDGQEANSFTNHWFGSAFPGLYIFAFAPTPMDADLPMNMLLKSGGQGYHPDPEIDRLLVTEIGQADPAARARSFGEISVIVNRRVYYAPLFTDTYTYGVAKGVTWTPRPDGMIVFN